MLRLCVSLGAIALLSGCAAGMNDDFTCGEIDGIQQCTSMTEVNAQAENGEYRTDKDGNLQRGKAQAETVTPVYTPITPLPPQQPVSSEVVIDTVTAPVVALKTVSAPLPLQAMTPQRQREDVRAVTIFPYIDTDGNYHDTSVIYTVLERSSWIPLPQYAIQSSSRK